MLSLDPAGSSGPRRSSPLWVSAIDLDIADRNPVLVVIRLLTATDISYYIKGLKLKLSWDEDKRKSNLRKHGLDFAHVIDFDTDSALVAEDVRGKTDPKFRYRERRYIALGLLRGKLVVLVYAAEPGGWRIISLRPAMSKEELLWLGK